MANECSHNLTQSEDDPLFPFDLQVSQFEHFR